MSALDNFLQAQGSYKPIVSKDAFKMERISRSGLAKEHNSFAVHGKLQDYEVDLEPVIVQKERYYNPPSKNLDVHWGLKNEPDGPFVNGAYPAKETNTFLRTPEALRLTHKQRKPRDPIKESGLFYFYGNKLPDRVEKDVISIDTISQRTIRDQVYSDGVPRSGLGMDIALASEQSKIQSGQNDKLYDIMQAVFQSSNENKRAADLLQQALVRPAPVAPVGATIEPAAPSEFKKALEDKFDELLKQRPVDIVRQIKDAQDKVKELQTEYEEKDEEVPAEFLSFADKLKGFQEEAFSTKWGEKKRVKRSEMMKENKEAVKALASLLITEEGYPVFEEFETPRSSRRSSVKSAPESAMAEPSEKASLSSSEKDAILTQQVLRALPKVPTKFEIGGNTYIVEGAVISKVMPNKTLQPLGGIKIDALKRFGGDINKVVDAMDKRLKIIDETARRKKDDDEASSYRGWETMASSKSPVFKKPPTEEEYTNQLAHDSSLLLQKMIDNKDFTKKDIGPIIGFMKMVPTRFKNELEGSAEALLNTLNKKGSLHGNLKDFLSNAYKEETKVEWEPDMQPLHRAAQRRASVESVASTIDEDFENLEELGLDEKATREGVQKALEKQMDSIKIEQDKPAGDDEPVEDPTLFNKGALIQDFNLNLNYKDDDITTLLEKVKNLDEDTAKRINKSLKKTYPRADYGNRTQSDNRKLLQTLIQLKLNKTKLYPDITQAKRGLEYIRGRKDTSGQIKEKTIINQMGLRKKSS